MDFFIPHWRQAAVSSDVSSLLIKRGQTPSHLSHKWPHELNDGSSLSLWQADAAGRGRGEVQEIQAA